MNRLLFSSLLLTIFSCKNDTINNYDLAITNANVVHLEKSKFKTSIFPMEKSKLSKQQVQAILKVIPLSMLLENMYYPVFGTITFT